VPALVALGLLVSTGPAAAESGPPGIWAAEAQYVEMLPTSTGPKPAGAAGSTKPLPTWLARRFARRGGTDAKALETLVTSTGWGAGASSGRNPVRRQEPSVQMLAVPLPQKSPSLFGALRHGSSSGGRATFALVALLVLLAAFTLARLRRSRR